MRSVGACALAGSREWLALIVVWMEGSFRFALSSSTDRQEMAEILPKREREATIWEHRKPARAAMQGRKDRKARILVVPSTSL